MPFADLTLAHEPGEEHNQGGDIPMCLAIPGRIVDSEQVGESRIGNVQFGGITRKVHLDFVPEAMPGDYVIVHVGFALSRLDAEEAARTFALLEQMEEASRE